MDLASSSESMDRYHEHSLIYKHHVMCVCVCVRARVCVILLKPLSERLEFSFELQGHILLHRFCEKIYTEYLLLFSH